MSVWTSIESLGDFVYRSRHADVMRRRREWFEQMTDAFVALWWIPEGHVPTVTEAKERLALLEANGPGPGRVHVPRPVRGTGFVRRRHAARRRSLRRLSPTIASSSAITAPALRRSSPRSGARTSADASTSRATSTSFIAAWNGMPCSPSRSVFTCSSAAALRSWTSVGDDPRVRRREAAHRTDRAALHPPQHQRFEADEDVQAVQAQVGLDRLERGIRHLHPSQVGRPLADAVDHVDRDRVAAAPDELVDVERQRLARARRR